MSKIDKILNKLYNGGVVSINDASKLLENIGYVKAKPPSSSSHITFRKEGTNPITLVKNRKELLDYQIKMIKDAYNG